MLDHILSVLELMAHPVLLNGSFLVLTEFAVVLLIITWLGILDHWPTIVHINGEVFTFCNEVAKICIKL